MIVPAGANQVTREKVTALQEIMVTMPQVEIPTSHYFMGGMYCRTNLLAEGTIAVGKIHKEEHMFMVVYGTVAVTTDEGTKEITGPAILTASSGTKRAAYALTDAMFLTVHITDKTDLDEIEKDLIEEEPMAMFDSHNKLKLIEGVIV